MRLYCCPCGGTSFHQSVQFLADAKQGKWYEAPYDATHIEQLTGKGYVLTRTLWACIKCGKEAKVEHLEAKEE